MATRIKVFLALSAAAVLALAVAAIVHRQIFKHTAREAYDAVEVALGHSGGSEAQFEPRAIEAERQLRQLSPWLPSEKDAVLVLRQQLAIATVYREYYETDGEYKLQLDEWLKDKNLGEPVSWNDPLTVCEWETRGRALGEWDAGMLRFVNRETKQVVRTIQAKRGDCERRVVETQRVIRSRRDARNQRQKEETDRLLRQTDAYLAKLKRSRN